MRSFWIALMIVFYHFPAYAQRIESAYTLQLFKDKTEAEAYFHIWTLPQGDPEDQKILAWRSGDPLGESPPLSPELVDCHLFGSMHVYCHRLKEEMPQPYQYFAVPRKNAQLYQYFAVPPFEALPTWAISFIDRWGLFLRYEFPPTVRIPAGLSLPDIPGRVVRRMPGIKRGPGSGYDPTGELYALGLSLVLIDLVISGEQAWSDVQRSIDDGRPIECRKDLGLCVVAIRLSYPNMPDGEKIYAACRSFLGVLKGKKQLTAPFDCRVVAHELDGARYLLAVTEVGEPGGKGGGFSGGFRIQGIASEAQLRNLVGRAVDAMGLKISGGPRGPMLVASTGVGVYNETSHRFIRRDISTVFDSEGPNVWVLTESIWVHQSVRDETTHWIMREDLVPVVETEFTNSLTTELRKACREVQIDNSNDIPGVVCVGPK